MRQSQRPLGQHKMHQSLNYRGSRRKRESEEIFEEIRWKTSLIWQRISGQKELARYI